MRMENTAVVHAVFAKTWATRSKAVLLKCHVPRGISKTQNHRIHSQEELYTKLLKDGKICIKCREETKHFHLKAIWKFLAYLKVDHWKASAIDTLH